MLSRRVTSLDDVTSQYLLMPFKNVKIPLETCISYKQTRANAFVCLSDLQITQELVSVF